MKINRSKKKSVRAATPCNAIVMSVPIG